VYDPVREEEVVVSARVQVRDAPAIAQDFDLVVERGDTDQARSRRRAPEKAAQARRDASGQEAGREQAAPAAPGGYSCPPRTRWPVGPSDPSTGSTVTPIASKAPMAFSDFTFSQPYPSSSTANRPPECRWPPSISHSW
jgi:hypothetical protein